MGVPRLARSPVEAAEALGMSRDSFDRYVCDEIRLVRVGQRVVVPVAELERYLNRHAEWLAEALGCGTGSTHGGRKEG